MDILQTIFAGGVVGAGGAGFPTHKKLVEGAELLIVNAAECEPLLCSDRLVMRRYADRIVEALQILQKELRIGRVVIGTKAGYEREIAALQTVITSRKADIAIHGVKGFYPAGDEQVLIYEITGKTVPPGGIPLALGIVVINVTTALNIWDAVQGNPVVEKFVTVSGSVREPCIVRAPVGAPVADCIAAAGGASIDDFFIVMGGPMMGRRYELADLNGLFIGKTDGGVLLLPRDNPIPFYTEKPISHILNQAKSVCIQCSYCSQMCPRYLIGHPLRPNRVMRSVATGTNPLELTEALLCCECGICELYACPMLLSPRQVNIHIKKELREAGVRSVPWEVDEAFTYMREHRRIPQSRIRARLNLMNYPTELDEVRKLHPRRVCIDLRHGIGQPSTAVVEAGERVNRGQLVAQVDFAGLGSQIHASIDGVVAGTEGRVVIERTGGAEG